MTLHTSLREVLKKFFHMPELNKNIPYYTCPICGIPFEEHKWEKLRMEALSSITDTIIKRVEELVSEYDDWDNTKYEEGYKRCLTDIIALLKGNHETDKV